MEYQTNFHKTNDGNAIKNLDTLHVSIKNADHVSGGIYKDGLPVQADFGFGDGGKAELEFKIAKRERVNGEWQTVGLAKGEYTLKVRAYIDNRGQGIDDVFVIVD